MGDGCFYILFTHCLSFYLHLYLFSRSDQSLDFAMLWERLSKHILFLKKHNVLLTEEVKEMFGILLISERNSPGGQVSSHDHSGVILIGKSGFVCVCALGLLLQ